MPPPSLRSDGYQDQRICSLPHIWTDRLWCTTKRKTMQPSCQRRVVTKRTATLQMRIMSTRTRQSSTLINLSTPKIKRPTQCQSGNYRTNASTLLPFLQTIGILQSSRRMVPYGSLITLKNSAYPKNASVITTNIYVLDSWIYIQATMAAFCASAGPLMGSMSSQVAKMTLFLSGLLRNQLLLPGVKDTSPGSQQCASIRGDVMIETIGLAV
jgi:hypothetical protein